MLFKQISLSSSPVGSPATITTMLEFAVQHDVKPVIEKFPFEQVNEAMEYLEGGKPHYHIVLHH